MAPRNNKADRIFVQNGRRLYRRRFSPNEARAGVVILFFLSLFVAWIVWKGAHPDPSLFMLETDLSQAGTMATVDRGPVPDGLTVAGWTEGAVSEFDYDNLYVKIDGREGYYKSFGFQRLYFVSIASATNPETAVDIELYDLGNSANAVGAYSGERSPDVTPELNASGLTHIDRNALYMTRGRFYLRAIGSDESSGVIALLEHLRKRFMTLPEEPLPWGFALFVGRMGLDPGALSYEPENAFSFGFANNVYSARLGDEGAELFVTPTRDAATAVELARRFRDGFLQYGTESAELIKDRYVGTWATATSVASWVVGVRGAADERVAREAVDDLSRVIENFPLPEIVEPKSDPNVEEENVTESDEY